MVVVLWQNWSEHIGRQLPNFWSSAILTDVVITVGSRSIKAHRMVLAFFSSYFKKMLEAVGEDRPMVIVFPEVNFDALQLIVAYMYRGQVNIVAELLPNVIELAKMLNVKGLLELPSQLEASNVNKQSNDLIDEDNSMDGLSSKGLVKLEVNAPPDIVLQPLPQVTIDLKNHGIIDDSSVVAMEQLNSNSSSSSSSSSSSVTDQTVNIESLHQDVISGLKVHEGTDDAEEHILIQPDDIQLSDIDHLTHTQIIKLSDAGEMPEVLLSDSYPYLPINPQQPQLPQLQQQMDTKEEEQIEQLRTKPKRKVSGHFTKYRPEDLKGALEELRSEAWTLREVAQRWNIPLSTLSLHARHSGIKLQRNTDYDPNLLKAAIQAVGDGASYTKASQQFNIAKSVVWRRCQREGIIELKKKKVHPYTTQDIEQAKLMLSHGCALNQVFKHTKNVPKTTLFRLKEQLIKEGQLPPSSICRVTRPHKFNVEDNLRSAISACQYDKLSQCEASEKYQVSKSTVWRRLKKIKDKEAKERNITINHDKLSTKLCSSNFKDEVCDQLSTSKCSEGMRKQKYSSFDLITPTTAYQSTTHKSFQPFLIKDKHIELITNSEQVIKNTDGMTVTADSKIFSASIHSDVATTEQFDFEMPLVNLHGGGYEVIDSEIVISGPQMVVLEPTTTTTTPNTISTGGYEVIDSEIVISGQQMVVLEPTTATTTPNTISTGGHHAHLIEPSEGGGTSSSIINSDGTMTSHVVIQGNVSSSDDMVTSQHLAENSFVTLVEEELVNLSNVEHTEDDLTSVAST